jgi:hypothetical protein
MTARSAADPFYKGSIKAPPFCIIKPNNRQYKKKKKWLKKVFFLKTNKTKVFPPPIIVGLIYCGPDSKSG